jgi:FKBP-type peptidyl-prolyl cis-trans isomerase (trigger factor)
LETSSKKLDDNKREITVTLTADEVQQEINAAYKTAGKNRIPGFRPGKAPRNVLENHYGGKEYFLMHATEELVRTNTPLAIDELNLVALASADYDEFDLVKEGEAFTFSFSVEVTPEFELSSYEPIQVEIPSAEPTDEEMQSQIDALLSYGTTLDEEGNEIKPELTDAWVKEILEFPSVDEFKARISESIRFQKEQNLAELRDIRSSLELAERLVGEVPEALVRQTEQDNYRDLFNSLQRQHLTLDAYLENYGYTPETFRESMHVQAKNSAAIALALDAWARHNNLTATDEEIVEEFENSGAKDPKKLYEDWRENGRLSEIRQGITRMKASELMNEGVQVFEPGTLTPQTPENKDEKKPAKKKAASSSAADKKSAAAKDKPAASKAKQADGKQDDTKKTTSSKTKSAKVDSNK